MGRVRLTLLLLALLAAAAGVLAGCSARETALRVMRPPQPEKRHSTWVHVAVVGNYRGTVRAFSMRNGARIWRANTDGKMAASPAALRDEVVVHGMHGHVYVLDRHNGRVLWRFNAGAPIESSPAV